MCGRTLKITAEVPQPRSARTLRKLTPDRKARFELTSIKLGNKVVESHLGC